MSAMAMGADLGGSVGGEHPGNLGMDEVDDDVEYEDEPWWSRALDNLADKLPYPRATFLALAIVLFFQFFGLWQVSRETHDRTAANKVLIVNIDTAAKVAIKQGCERRNQLRSSLLLAVEESQVAENVVAALRRELRIEDCDKAVANLEQLLHG